MEQASQNVVAQKSQKKQVKWWYPAKKLRASDGGRDKWVSTYYRKFRNPTISLRISPASYFDNKLMIHLELMWISWYIHLPIYSTIDECEYPEFGWYYHSNSLVLCWNMKKKFIHMLWTYEWIRTSRLLKDGTWENEVKGGKRKEYSKERDQWELENLWSETHHVTYVTTGGEIQDDIEATIKVQEIEWRQKWLMWTKWGNKVSKSINVDFNNEVGNQRGSWKGGVLGCSEEIKGNEKPLRTLRRMMKERNFDR